MLNGECPSFFFLLLKIELIIHHKMGSCVDIYFLVWDFFSPIWLDFNQSINANERLNSIVQQMFLINKTCFG